MNDCLLRASNGVFNYFYDFKLRVMTNGSGSTIPFSQLDRGVLIEMRDKLIELGGKPPELPPEASATQAPAKKFNL